ncbi:hypothetical protein Clacol_001178 [Clathrus columnatus]|uniref:Uncharacterized protein n=1 Tax=Clathrus columnatus TaxID=1419009 RepID=A0AAV5A1U3_9AGAM|nr:hypothetical protein Clacol_001178 [Clathrus columnatus]
MNDVKEDSNQKGSLIPPRSVSRKKRAVLAANQVELLKSKAIVEACAMSRVISRQVSALLEPTFSVTDRDRDTTESPDEKTLDGYCLSLLGNSRESPQPSSSCLLDSLEDEPNSEQLSDDDSSGATEDADEFSISTTWNYDTVQEEEVFVKRLYRYHDEIDGFTQMDISCLKRLLESREAELPDAWTAVKVRELIVYQVATLEQLLQRIEFKEWDTMVTFMANASTEKYNRSRTLAYMHQRQADFLKAGLESGKLDHNLSAFKDWWLTASPWLHHRVAKV